MNLLRKIKNKWAANKAPKQQIDPSLKKWGYEVLFDQLLEAMDPSNYKVEENEHGFLIYEKYHKLDSDKERSGEIEWKKRFANGNATKPGHFKTFDDAIKGIEKIIKKADKDFGQLTKQLENEKDD